LCNIEIAEETHHLNPQKNADKNGFIGTFHKNHKANLASVCEACHDKIHASANGKMLKKKTTKGFVLERAVSKISILVVDAWNTVMEKLFNTLKEANIKVEMCATSEGTISVLIPQHQADLAVNLLHSTYGLDAQ
jgi:aspartokinase